MKRIGLYVVVIAMIGLFAVPAYAGVKEVIASVTDGGIELLVGSAIGIIFMIVGALGGAKYTVWKAPTSELKDVFFKVQKARRESSPGGKKIVEEEWQGILKEVEETVFSTLSALGKNPQAT